MVGGKKLDDDCVRCWVGESCAACVELRCGRRLRCWIEKEWDCWAEGGWKKVVPLVLDMYVVETEVVVR